MPSSSSARKLLDDNWALTASYVWSRLYGNYSAPLQNGARTDAPNPTSERPSTARSGCPDGERALYGRLATNHPHQAEALGIYTAPFGIDVGVFQSLASGLPVSRSAVLTPGVVAFYAGRGSDGRTPAVSQTDLNVQSSIRLGGRKGQQLTLGLNVLNVFNQARGVSRGGVSKPTRGFRSSSTRLTTMRDVPTSARQSTSSTRHAILASLSTSSFRSHARLE